MFFMGKILLGQKYYFYGLMPKSRLKLLFLQKINPMKIYLSFVLLALLGIAFPMRAQVTIKIEKLSVPDSFLPVESPEEIFKTFIEEDAGVTKYDIEENDFRMDYGLLALKVDADSLVTFGSHSFISGMREAYWHHRPVTLSPDMIWVLIAQGFSHHVNANAEALRDRIVDFKGKKELVCEFDVTSIGQIDWEKAVDSFSVKIAENTKSDIAEIIKADFSTTTQVERIASEITLMSAVKDYFVFTVSIMGCGIPYVVLEGTPEDWQRVYDKAMQLRDYDLGWWIDELEPVLRQIVASSKGEIDNSFWMNMFRIHTKEVYGSPECLNGWMAKFYPYNRYEERLPMDTLYLDDIDRLPDEMVKVDVRVFNEMTGKETFVELWAGFVGLAQNNENYMLTPKMGWMVRKKDVGNEFQRLKMENEEGYSLLFVQNLPVALRQFDTLPIRKLEIDFREKPDFPEWFWNLNIEQLRVKGKISEEERRNLLQHFDDVTLDNAWYFNTGDGWVAHIKNGNVFEQIEGLKHVKLLSLDATIIGHEDDLKYRPIGVGPDWVPLNIEMPESWEEVQVDSISVRLNESENEPLNLLRRSFPNTAIKALYEYYSFGEIQTMVREEKKRRP
jgi:hypothetical protein